MVSNLAGEINILKINSVRQTLYELTMLFFFHVMSSCCCVAINSILSSLFLCEKAELFLSGETVNVKKPDTVSWMFEANNLAGLLCKKGFCICPHLEEFLSSRLHCVH